VYESPENCIQPTATRKQKHTYGYALIFIVSCTLRSKQSVYQTWFCRMMVWRTVLLYKYH